ncbi:MAG: GNAT family N-acetyltransferase [Acidimicrobiales bacterium]
MAVPDEDLTIRPIIGPEELDLFCQLPYVLNGELSTDLEKGRRCPEWMWVALRNDRVVARVGWWGRLDDGVPSHLDIVDVDDHDSAIDRVGTIAALLEVAMGEVVPVGSSPPEYGRFVPPDWRDHEQKADAVATRMAALERAGARLLVERLRYEWLPSTPIDLPSRRMIFRSAHDEEEIIALMSLALEKTLDAHSRQDLREMSAREAAIRHYEGELKHYRSPREWWRVATLADGEPVGFVMPARNDYNAIIAYIAVLPRHRGSGYIDDILREGTRILASHDVERIRASTDIDNVPMAKAFERAGYVNFEREINMAWGL